MHKSYDTVNNDRKGHPHYVYKSMNLITLLLCCIYIGIDVATGHLSKSCLPSNHYPWPRMGSINVSLHITVLLHCSSFFFTLYQGLSGKSVLSQEGTFSAVYLPPGSDLACQGFSSISLSQIPKPQLLLVELWLCQLLCSNISRIHILSYCSIPSFLALCSWF